MIMETDRILLRHWHESDADVLYEYASEPEVGERAGWPPHKSREQSLEIIRTVFNNPTTWAIVLKETGKVVGAMGYGPSCDSSLPSREGGKNGGEILFEGAPENLKSCKRSITARYI